MPTNAVPTNAVPTNGMSANDSAVNDTTHIGTNGNGASAYSISDYGAPADTTDGDTESRDNDDSESPAAAANGAASLSQDLPPTHDAMTNDLSEGTPSAQPAKPTLSETNGTYSESAPSSESDDAPPWDDPAPFNGTNGAVATTETNGTNGHTPQNDNDESDGASVLPSRPVEADTPTPAEAGQRLLLRLTEGEPEHDRRMLQILSSILMDYQGECEVTLEIATAGYIVEMDWPAVRVHANEELIARLKTEALGAAGEARLIEI